MVAKKTVSARALFSIVVFILSIVLFFTERKLSDGNREVGLRMKITCWNLSIVINPVAVTN